MGDTPTSNPSSLQELSSQRLNQRGRGDKKPRRNNIHNNIHNNNRQRSQGNNNDETKPSLRTSSSATSTTTTTTTTITSNEPKQQGNSDSEEEGDVCLICCEAIQEYAVGHCNHRDLCAMCTLKRRDLYKEDNCCICKAPLPTVIYTTDSSKPFEDFVLHSYIFDSKRNSHFEDEHFYKKVIKLWEFKCPVCSVPAFAHFEPLKKHLKKEHKLVYCDLCVADRKVFFAEQQVYTHAELMKHMVDWDGGIGGSSSFSSSLSSSSSSSSYSSSQNNKRWKGHPMCEFCSRHFYGMDQLYKHLQENHFTCHVCEKAGSLYQYYRDYAELERHFTQDHFPCAHPECQEQKFVFFGTMLDLKAHQLTHSGTGKKQQQLTGRDRQMEFNFTYLRAGRSGEGVDDPLERSYKHRTRRRDAGYGSDSEDPTPSSSSGSAPPSSTSNKKKGKSKKAQTDARNEDGPTGNNTNNNNNNNNNNNTTNANTRAGTRAPQSFAPGFRNRGEPDSTASTTTSTSTTTTSEAEREREREQEREAERERQRAVREKAERESEEQERQREEIQRERNKQLVKDLKNAIGESAYAVLRESSGEYRTGNISAREYYASLFGSLRRYPHLLIHLVALLPDEQKKTALERVHSEYMLWESAYPSLDTDGPSKTQNKKGIKGKERNRYTAVAWDLPKKTTALPNHQCPLCGDVIPGADKEKHEYFHSRGSPITPLSSSPPVSNTSNKTNGAVQIQSKPEPAPPPPEPRPAPPAPVVNPLFENEASFPSLSGTTSSLAAMSMSAWNRGRQGPQSQDFPSLSQTPAHSSSSHSSSSAQYFERDEDTPAKRSGKKSKKKSQQVLFHFG